MPVEPRTAFIHIGLPKTGTTAIQAAAAHARGALAAAGYHYLSGDRDHGERLCLAFWDRPDALRLAGLRWQDGAAAAAHRAEVQAALAEEIDAAAPRHLILSAEDASTFRRSEVERFCLFLGRRFEKLTVLAWLRDPLDWASSAAQQAVKWSGDLLDDLFDRPRLPGFETRLGPWRDVVGSENILYREYGAGDVVSDFCRAIGLTKPLEAGGRLNEAISSRTAIVFSAMNALRPPFVEARHNPLRSFDVVRDGRLPGRRFTLPRETVESWEGALAEERDWARQALGRRAFDPPERPAIGRAAWYGQDRAALEGFAGIFLEKARLAQNERALRMYLKAREIRGDPGRAVKLLDHAWLLTTDRWTLDRIAQEALEQDRGDREKFFAKGRLMRRIETPEPGDAALVVGNPFDRPWSSAPPASRSVEPAA